MIARRLYSLVFTFLVLFPVLVHAALPAVRPSVRYMSLGDSLAAGYKAQPATKGFAYQLYLNEVFGSTPDTAFDNAAVPGARSSDVLQFQIPQVALFDPTVVTISVGGNDLLTLLAAPDPNTVVAVLGAFGANLTAILENLCIEMPINGEIYLNNLYTIPEIPGADFIVPLFNGAMRCRSERETPYFCLRRQENCDCRCLQRVPGSAGIVVDRALSEKGHRLRRGAPDEQRLPGHGGCISRCDWTLAYTRKHGGRTT